MLTDNKQERIYDVLRAEHDAVADLFKQAKAADSPEERTTAVDQLYRELMAHAHAEQRTVYNRVKERFPEPEIVDEAEQEHTEIEQRLKMLRDLDPSSENWDHQLKELEERVKHHVKEEEHKFFGEMKDVLSEEDAVVMATDFQEAKQRELEDIMVNVR